MGAMTRLIARIPRAAGAALLGGLAGAAWLVLTYAVSPSFTLKLDRDLPALAKGFYPVERDGVHHFVWTTGHAEIRLPGLDRRSPWRCTVRLRGARPDPSALPEVTFTVDGTIVETRVAPNDFQEVVLPVPARPTSRGLILGVSTSSTFRPGSHDPRDLGVMIDELGCSPSGGAVALPPQTALTRAVASAAIFGAAFGLTGITPGSAVGSAVLLAAAQAVPLSTGLGPYSGYAASVPWLALWIALSLVVGLALVEGLHRVPLRNTARFVAVFSAGAMYLKLLVLLHPDKAIGDALFHAHRFEWVLAGRYVFTSIAPGGYQFPYAVGLYLAAWPFTFVTHDLVLLLRIVVAVADALSGMLLYLMIVRAWKDRLAGAVAVALFHFIPLSIDVQGVANLTNAFAQSLALVSIAVISSPALYARAALPIVTATIVLTAAFLSHTSTFAILFLIVLLTAALYQWRGSEAMRPAAAAVLICLIIATGLSVAVYYGRFGDVYRSQFNRIVGEVRASDRHTVPIGAASGGNPVNPPRGVAASSAVPDPHSLGGRPVADRVAAVPGYLGAYFGWPAVLLGLLGAWRLRQQHSHDRLTLALIGWASACALFLILGLLTPIDMRYYLAFYPALAMLAGAGATWGWYGPPAARAAVGALLAWAILVGARAWAAWI